MSKVVQGCGVGEMYELGDNRETLYNLTTVRSTMTYHCRLDHRTTTTICFLLLIPGLERDGT